MLTAECDIKRHLMVYTGGSVTKDQSGWGLKTIYEKMLTAECDIKRHRARARVRALSLIHISEPTRLA